ncbi:type VII secretion integral membrane protein EccD [Kribbella sp.]|uniref:type VII secretion integral membrane protein EccD n=1 Tax=Kribbella sp. TaxID=1871183 RepID=UPI002D53751C|nr:type VII secretion integral membrane protein EccD [Kribbella sp.]HZX08777.1 type VII secretion integral membrane protein EccD [Kribbella sp.]
MSVYSRVTVIGQRRRLDAVLPADEPLGVLLPDLLRMLDEPLEQSPQRRYLTTATGVLVPPEGTLQAAQVIDGSVLRLASEGELPPPPTVYDVTEEAVEDLKRRGTTFKPQHRRILAGAGLVFSIIAGAISLLVAAPNGVTAAALLVLTAICAFVGIALGRSGNKVIATPLVTVATVVLALTVGFWALNGGWELGLVITVGALCLAFGPLFYAAAGLAGGGVVAGATAVLFVAVWMIGVGTGLAAERVGALAALLAVLLLGLLPRMALALSGLSGLDDKRAAGQEIMRGDVRTALNAAHLGLALATLPIAVSSAVAGLMLLKQGGAWAVALALVLAFLLASRSRLYPLVSEVAVLFAAAFAIVSGCVLIAAVNGQGGAFIALGLLVLVAMFCAFGLSFAPAEHVRARLTQLLDYVEVVAIVATVPLTLGVFGVYTSLLNKF